MANVTPTDRRKSVRDRGVIEFFGGVFALSRCFLDFSVGVGAFLTEGEIGCLTSYATIFHLYV